MVDVIIVAAGSGSRMKVNINKQFLRIKYKPLIVWSIEKFYNHPQVDNITIAIRQRDEEFMKDILKEYGFKNIKLVYGGRERQHSIYNCIKEINDTDILIIHDGARPFISDEIIDSCIYETHRYGCTCVGVPAKDTIKVINEKNLVISDTPNRDTLWCAQTPQSFKFDIIKKAHEHAHENNIEATDDSSLVEMMGHEVRMIMGSYSNIKITTPEDLRYAKFLLHNEKGK